MVAAVAGRLRRRQRAGREGQWQGGQPQCRLHLRRRRPRFVDFTLGKSKSAQRIKMAIALSLCDSEGHFEILLKCQFQCFSKL